MLDRINKIHLVGVGGIGASALAKFFVSQGKQVSGSDLESSFITDDLRKLGVKIFAGHHQDNLALDTDLLVYSDAVPESNPERQKAQVANIKQLSYFEFLGVLSNVKSRTIAVSGNKGKTTTTAMIGWILESARLDPTVIVGSYVNNWQSNFRHGGGSYFVVEGDEWKNHMNNLNPWAIVLTNIEPDHLDYFGTFENEVFAFQNYLMKLPGNGLYFYNGDDPVVAGLKRPPCKAISFGRTGDLSYSNRQVDSGRQLFRLWHRGQDLGQFILKQPGLFNVYNAMAATAVALELKIGVDAIRQALASFLGAWRRFQSVGNYKGVPVFSDYAHHPTAVKATIEAAKEFFPGKRIVVAFQPHHHHRTKALFNEFVSCFDESGLTVLAEIYQVAGRDQISNVEISSLDLVKAIREHDKRRGSVREVVFAKDLTETRNALDDRLDRDDVILLMGAGDIYKLEKEFK